MSRPSAVSIAAGVQTGERRAVAVVEAALERVARRNPALNALVDLDPDTALADARRIDARVAAGERLPLAGVPLVVKDNIWVRGRRITQGSRLFADFVAPDDAVAVARARAAGAVILGIGACSEFGCKGNTVTPLHGATRNPVDPALTAGGSSGGPAAAVGSGMAPLALGTDAGGSGRRPPAHCGVVGFKPSLGAIPYGPGFAEPGWDISVVAPIAASVADAALLFEALAGPSGRDPASDTALAAARDPGTLRIAFAATLGFDVPVDDDVAEVTRAAVERLAAAGVAIRAAAPAWPEGCGETAIMPLQHAGLAALHGERWRSEPDLFDPDIGAQIEAGLALTGAEVALALEASQRIRRAFSAVFEETDLLVCPTTPCPAWPVDERGPATIGGRPAGPRGHAVFTPHVNHARLPAISIPCGTTAAGLPLGLQIVAARGQDRSLLAAAAGFETVLAER